MQAIRFGAFTPAQQAKLDQLTGGKTVRDAAMDSFQPALTSQEKRQLLDNRDLLEGVFQIGLMQCPTPDVFEQGMLTDLLPEFQAIQQQQQNATDPAEVRENLRDKSSFVTAMVETSSQWAQTLTDKTFDALLEMVDSLKTSLKF